MRPDISLLQQFADVVTPHISDNQNRLHALSSGLRARTTAERMSRPSRKLPA
jgi:hypothetical protein